MGKKEVNVMKIVDISDTIYGRGFLVSIAKVIFEYIQGNRQEKLIIVVGPCQLGQDYRRTILAQSPLNKNLSDIDIAASALNAMLIQVGVPHRNFGIIVKKPTKKEIRNFQVSDKNILIVADWKPQEMVYAAPRRVAEIANAEEVIVLRESRLEDQEIRDQIWHDLNATIKHCNLANLQNAIRGERFIGSIIPPWQR